MKKLLIALLLFSSSAFAGGSNPGLYYGFTPTAGQWNSYFANKLDYTPGTVNQMGYWDGSGNFLNAAVSGDCTSVANVFSCAHVGSVLAGPGEFTTITGSGIANITNTTASTSPTTGALTVAGGMGIGGNINTSGGYTQTGTAANTFNGQVLFSTGANSWYVQQNGGDLDWTHQGIALGPQFFSGGGINIPSFYQLNALILFSSTAPTIASGFGTTPSIVNSNGTASFSVDVGTGGTATSGVITLPAATTNWNCAVINPLSGAGTLTQQSAHTATSVTLTNYTISTDVAVAWTASYVIELNCVAK